MHLLVDSILLEESKAPVIYGLDRMQGNPLGSDLGLIFDFGADFQGRLSYSVYDRQGESILRDSSSLISNGVAEVNLLEARAAGMDGATDANVRGRVEYRVYDEEDLIVFIGAINFLGVGPFMVDTTIVEGPFINQIHPHGGTVSLRTNVATIASIHLGSLIESDSRPTKNHVLHLNGLESDSLYKGNLKIGSQALDIQLQTLPRPGTRRPFNFAVGPPTGGIPGDTSGLLFGVHREELEHVVEIAELQNSTFLHFNSDIISGELNHAEDLNLQYANWKYVLSENTNIPTYVSLGQNEVLTREFKDSSTGMKIGINYFPFETNGSEFIFSENFSYPNNGPASEDGTTIDVDRNDINFPEYLETVYYYVYDNVAMIVLNSEYLSLCGDVTAAKMDGNISGYLMNGQLSWLAKVLDLLEADGDIDHIFINTYTPLFPNTGEGEVRPRMHGVVLSQSVLDQRDHLLDLLINRTQKVRAILSGAEGGYHKLQLTDETQMYRDSTDEGKLQFSRTIYQINCGGSIETELVMRPWTPFVSNFNPVSTVVVFEVYGRQIFVRAMRTDTRETIDQFWLVN